MGNEDYILRVDIAIPNQLRYLGFIGEIGEKIAHELDHYTGDRHALAYHLNLALTEALVNAIEHGSTGDPRQTVHVSIRLLDEVLCIQVYDQGQGFDLDAIPLPDLDNPLERGRGIGIYLIKSIMDSVCYRRTEQGNLLEMRKRLA
jgi:serine/threonine-protein kinase RsbW